MLKREKPLRIRHAPKDAGPPNGRIPRRRHLGRWITSINLYTRHFYGPGHFESRTRIGLVVLGVVLTVSFLLVGLFGDLEPSPPDGELVTAIADTVVPDSLGHLYYVSVRAATSQGRVTCSMGKSAFSDGVLPPLDAQIPIDWTPESCSWGEPAEQLPRWFFFLVAGIAGTLTGGWLFRSPSRSDS